MQDWGRDLDLHVYLSRCKLPTGNRGTTWRVPKRTRDRPRLFASDEIIIVVVILAKIEKYTTRNKTLYTGTTEIPSPFIIMDYCCTLQSAYSYYIVVPSTLCLVAVNVQLRRSLRKLSAVQNVPKRQSIRKREPLISPLHSQGKSLARNFFELKGEQYLIRYI